MNAPNKKVVISEDSAIKLALAHLELKAVTGSGLRSCKAFHNSVDDCLSVLVEIFDGQQYQHWMVNFSVDAKPSAIKREV